MAWSKNGRYFSVGSPELKQMRVFQVDKESLENIWTVVEAQKADKYFWNKFPINLVQSTIE